MSLISDCKDSPLRFVLEIGLNFLIVDARVGSVPYYSRI